MSKRKRYYTTIAGHAEGIDIAVRSPDRRVICNIAAFSVFGDDTGIDEAKRDAQFIVDALNAYAKGRKS